MYVTVLRRNVWITSAKLFFRWYHQKRSFWRVASLKVCWRKDHGVKAHRSPTVVFLVTYICSRLVYDSIYSQLPMTKEERKEGGEEGEKGGRKEKSLKTSKKWWHVKNNKVWRFSYLFLVQVLQHIWSQYVSILRYSIYLKWRVVSELSLEIRPCGI